jgi:hypothetical protein
LKGGATYRQLIERLQEQDLAYAELELGGDARLVITERGGRLFGPFLSPEEPGLLWTNSAFEDPQAFEAFLAAEEWNLGGERIWIAPEIQYTIRDRKDFWGSYALPREMDPGSYRLSRGDDGRRRLYQDLCLRAYNPARGEKRLHLERSIRAVPDPLRELPDYAALVEGVTYTGYEQAVSIFESHTDAIVSESWNLLQLNPGGVLLIPASPHVSPTDYFEPIDEAHQTIGEGHVRLRITGERRYKVGYKAAHLFGRLGYLNRLADGRAYLLVRAFFNNPSASYAEEPPHRPGCCGHSVHVYNDGGEFGGFGELECNGQAIGGGTGRSSSTDLFLLWAYVGTPGRIAAVTRHLLGVAPPSLEVLTR